MTPRRLPTPLALAIGVAVALVGLVHAQAPATPPSATLTPYRDRIIAAERLQPLTETDDELDELDAKGPPRSFHAEISTSQRDRGGERFGEQGLAFGGFWETASLGSFSLDAAMFSSDRPAGDRGQTGRERGVTATLWQRNYYLDGGWRGDNGLGVLNTPSLPLQRRQYRFYLPGVVFAGASTEWRNAAAGLQWQAAVGRSGRYTGGRLVGFEQADGSVGSLGAQWSWAPQWVGAIALLATDDRLAPDSRGEAIVVSGRTQALHATTAWQGERDDLQFNLLQSDGDRRAATGAWLDGSARRGRYSHNYGAYRFGPDLAWGALPINNDVEGGYYRVAYQYGRWNWSSGLDALQSISGAGLDALYATGYARYQATSRFGYGGSLSLRRSPDLAHSLQLFTDRRGDWGQTRLQFDQASAPGDSQGSWRLGLDHAFALREGARLSTSVAYGRIAQDAGDANDTTTLALYGGRDLGGRVSIDGSARWTHGNGPTAQRGVDLNLGMNWRVSPRWQLSTTVYQSQGSQRSPFVLDPLVTGMPFIAMPRDRSLFLSLRYDRHTGRPQAILGGSPGGPSGSLVGSVYLDDNGDDVRAASEQPVVNITVVLDGRYSVQTDTLGRFEFPRVAAGTHYLTVVPDNLPLPWMLDEAQVQRSIQVTVRGQARVDIGAQRPR